MWAVECAGGCPATCMPGSPQCRCVCIGVCSMWGVCSKGDGQFVGLCGQSPLKKRHPISSKKSPVVQLCRNAQRVLVWCSLHGLRAARPAAGAETAGGGAASRHGWPLWGGMVGLCMWQGTVWRVITPATSFEWHAVIPLGGQAEAHTGGLGPAQWRQLLRWLWVPGRALGRAMHAVSWSAAVKRVVRT